MRYRKFKADYLFTGEHLLNGEKVLITDGTGQIYDIMESKDAGENIEECKGILSPGFVNAHCHLELSHLKKRIAENTGLIDFVFSVVTQRDVNEEDMLKATRQAEDEMIQNGIVAVGDISNNLISLTQKSEKSLSYYNFIELSGWLPQLAEIRFEKGRTLKEEFEKLGLPVSIVPHAPYSVSDDLWKKMIPTFHGKTVSIHNQETADEDIFFLEGKGDFTKMYEMMKIDNSFYRARKMRSVESYFEKFSTAASVILVHNTFSGQQDIDFVKAHTNKDQIVSFCLCPNANLYIENTLPPVNLFLKNGVNIILGTDSLASNHQLNILEEIKVILNEFPEIPTDTLLRWATINGAKALQMDHNLGSFEKGKKPGILLIENSDDGKINKDSKIKRLL